MVSGFLFKTKEEVQRVTNSRKLSYSQWKAKSTSSPSEDDLDEDEDEHSYDSNSSPGGSTESAPPNNDNDNYHPPKIARTLRQIHADTSADLSRTTSRSRRQKNEVRRGVSQRINRRLPTQEYGFVNDDLSLSSKEEDVKKRMRERAFGIRVGGSRDGDGYKGDGGVKSWGSSEFERLAKREGMRGDGVVGL